MVYLGKFVEQREEGLGDGDIEHLLCSDFDIHVRRCVIRVEFVAAVNNRADAPSLPRAVVHLHLLDNRLPHTAR